ncbi:MAG: sensor histidine kinase, partial [Planctomycetota bacterium]
LSVLLFQTVRELLLNVVKHAAANAATVSVHAEDGEVRISVEDDGVGFDAAALGVHGHRTEGFGLFSIRERLDHLGGRLELQSEPGAGTRAVVTAPVTGEGAAREGRES